jgi:hypothetical protein
MTRRDRAEPIPPLTAITARRTYRDCKARTLAGAKWFQSQATKRAASTPATITPSIAVTTASRKRPV